MAYISIHLFPSLTGGHDVLTNAGGADVIFKPGAYPWRHLRDPHWEPPVHLNRWREAQYRDVAERHLRIREWAPEYWEDEKYLDDSIQRALPGYAREELLKRSVLIVAEHG
jgi:hypothetical protein